MPRAVVLTSAGKANTTGGTFADTLTAAGTDSLAVANFQDGGARIINMWGMDSANVAEVQMFYTRPQSTHDQAHGYRAQIASKLAGTAGKIGAQDLLPGDVVINVYPSDVATVQASTTAADSVGVSYQILYDDLPGAAGVFISPSQAASLQRSTLGLFCNAAAPAAASTYGVARAINADDNRLHANTWYAIVGYTMQLPVTTISFVGFDLGGQRVGGPGDPLAFHTAAYFLDQSRLWGLPLVPCFNSNNAGSFNLQVFDVLTANTPLVDVVLYELSAPPTPGS